MWLPMKVFIKILCFTNIAINEIREVVWVWLGFVCAICLTNMTAAAKFLKKYKCVDEVKNQSCWGILWKDT